MKQKRSEIFEGFAKIAIENGLIEINAESRTQEEKLKDSDYKNNIKALYNIDLDAVDIQDLAHPKNVSVSPSYDKINGLVLTPKEKHNVMVGVANRKPTGNLLSQMYANAHDDLLGELVRLGFSMDNKKIDDLRILADSCSERITKKAFLPLVAGGIAAVVALIAIINHTSPSDQGVYNNCEKAIVEIQELKPKMPLIADKLDQLLSNLKSLQVLSTQYNSLGGIDASTPDKLVNIAVSEKNKLDIAKKYKTACAYMAGKVPQYIQLINSFKMTENHRSYDWWKKIKNVAEYFTANDKEDVSLALETLQHSLEESVKEANQFMSIAKEQEPSLIAYLNNMKNSDVPETSQETTEYFPGKTYPKDTAEAEAMYAKERYPEADKIVNHVNKSTNKPEETPEELQAFFEGHPMSL